MIDDDDGAQQMMQAMGALGGMAAIASADLPARIAKTWAETAVLLSKLIEPRVLGQTDGKPQVQILLDDKTEERVYGLIDFCIERVELIAATQPPVRPQEPDEEEPAPRDELTDGLIATRRRP